MPKLFMIIIGCTPLGRHTEQHDVFFGIADHVRDLIPEMIAFWPEAKGKLHLDAYREVTEVDGFKIEVVPAESKPINDSTLFFLNLGGYKPDVFDELHYRMLVIAEDKAKAIAQAKQSTFYKHTGFEGATSHIDDKYGVDVDDVFEISDVLSEETKQKYTLKISKAEHEIADEIHLGYFQLYKL